MRESHPVNLVSSPTKFGEYLAAGVPVILTEGIGDYSEMAETMHVGITLKIDGKNFSDEAQEKLRLFSVDVMKNRNLWATRCMKTVKEELDWNVFGSRLANAYESLLIPLPRKSQDS